MPANLLTRRHIPNKLLWISLSFSLPIAVLLYFMIAGINRDISFAERELAGIEYQRPLHDLLRHLARHQWLAGASSVDSDLSSEQGKVDQAFQRLDGMQRRFGIDLQVTEAGLAQRQRSNSLPQDMAAAWLKLKADTSSASGVLGMAQQRQLRDAVQRLVSHVVDTSNLVLDPDLDSYYLMDATSVGLPRLQHRLAELRLSIRESFAKPELDSADLVKIVRRRHGSLAEAIGILNSLVRGNTRSCHR